MEIKPETMLYELESSLVDSMSGPVYDLIEAAGFDESPRRAINQLNAWGLTWAQFCEEMEADKRLAEERLAEEQAEE